MRYSHIELDCMTSSKLLMRSKACASQIDDESAFSFSALRACVSDLQPGDTGIVAVCEIGAVQHRLHPHPVQGPQIMS